MFTQKMKFKDSSKGTVVINGQSFKGNSVQFDGSKLIIDGVVVHNSSQSSSLVVNLVGDCEYIHNQSGDVSVIGSVSNISTTSGDVDVGGSVSGSCSTVSGDITALTIHGPVNTVSGSVQG